MFSKYLQQSITALFKSNEQQAVSEFYLLAEQQLCIHYWSLNEHDCFYRSLQHIRSASISSPPSFQLFVLPAHALNNETCMINARKQFLASICKKNGLVPASQNTRHLNTKCHKDYFYIIDFDNGYALWVINSYAPMQAWYKVSPFQHFFQEWMTLSSKQMAHAAAIGNHQGAILFTGASGAGKTTTTLLALHAGYQYISEDYCVLSKMQQSLTVYSVFNAMKLTQKTEAEAQIHFSQKPLLVQGPYKSKQAYYLAEEQHIQIKVSASVNAICSLSVGNTATPLLTKQQPNDAIRALAFSTIRQNPIYANQSLKQFYSYLTLQPLYHLCLSAIPKRNLVCIEELFNG